MSSGDEPPPALVSSPAGDPLIGRQLGEYVVRERIGEGGFGAVYRAQQPALSREAVIKVLRFRRRADDGVLRRFTAEAQVASRLDHPYAAHIYGFGAEPDGLLWIAMELVRGAPLDVTLTMHGPIKLDRFVPLFERICEVVHTAHEQGIVHRDIKPANIMVLSRAGRLLPKLLDFGIAKVLSSALSPELAGLALTSPMQIDAIGPDAKPDLGATAPMSAAPNSDSPPLLQVANPAHTGNEILGSPRYMAPEQWSSPKEVDARADLYALGAVAYEALTGKPAFEGVTMAAVMAAHAQPIPKLPAGFPKQLDDVLARATAKQARDRYTSAIELAEALRAAAGLKTERAALPQLDRKVRNRFVERSPEPLADAIVAFENAENVHAARDALGHVARSIGRWIGLLALSCRTRVGPGESSDAAAVTQRLRTLRRDGLRDVEWLELARDLARPFATKRDAYPIPDLVGALFPRDGDPDAGKLLESLLKLQSTTDPAETQLRARFPDLVKHLGDVLIVLWFLTDYDLLVPRGGRAERYIGSRRVPRVSMPADELAEHDGKPIIVDGDGLPVLVLWPLVQAEAPSPGADRELFVLDGPGRSGARLIAPRQAFEIHDAALWDWFQQKLLADDDGGKDVAIDERPYRGLSAFTESDADLFYGREREVDVFVNRLRVTPLLAVVGPSGAGKSSFVQAGALPALGWRSIIMRPGASPLAALAARLGNLVTARDLGERPDLLGVLLRGDVKQNVVLVVDQLEELFTLCSDATEREQFARAIAAASRTADDPVRVVVTLRDDFLMRAEGLPALRERLAAGLHLLGTPQREDLIRILVEPAKRAGYTFEDDKLPEEMVDAVADRPGALALLSFTAASLWELRDRHFRHLSRKAYQAIGGVGGALARHAEETLAKMPADQRALVRDAFRRLVTAEGTRAVLTRKELAQVLGGTPKAEDVIEALIGARLLTASEAEKDEHVEVTHEALLSAWPRLVEWRREDADGARLRDQLRAAARQWDERGRPSGLLWRGDALAEFQLWRGRTAGSLTATEDAFTGAAVREAARGRRIRRILLGGAFGFLTIALGGALWLTAQTKTERAKAVQSLAALHEEQGRLELLAGRPGPALVHLARALDLGAHGPALEVMIAAAARPIEAARLTLDGGDKLWSIAYSHDGRFIVTGGAGGHLRVWDTAGGRLVLALRGHTKDVIGVGFSTDDLRIVSSSWDGTVRVWDAASGVMLQLMKPGDPVRMAALAPDDTLLAIASNRGKDAFTGTGVVQIWNARNGRLALSVPVTKWVRTLAWNRDSSRLVTSSGDGLVEVWDPRTAQRLATLEGHTKLVARVTFSPDDRRIATASSDGTAMVWDAASGQRIATLAGHTDRVLRVEFSPDSKWVVSTSIDSTARVWEAGSGRLQTLLAGHVGAVLSATFSPRGDLLLTTAADGTARLWDPQSGALIALRDGHAGHVYASAFRGDGNEIATASWDGTAKVWDTTPDYLVASINTGAQVVALDVAPDGRMASTGGLNTLVWNRAWRLDSRFPPAGDVAFDRDGARLVTAEDRVAKIWRVTDGQLLQTFAGHEDDVIRVQFSDDGGRVVTVSLDRTVRIWNLNSPSPPVILQHELWIPQHARFTADARRVVTASNDGVTRIWSSETGREEPPLAKSSGWIWNVELSPDGRRAITAHQEGIATIWDMRTRDKLGVLEGHGDVVRAVQFNPSGDLIVTGSGDQTVRVWDASRFKPLLVFRGHTSEIHDAIFGARDEVASASADGTIRRWRVTRDRRTPSEIAEVVRCRVPWGLDGNGSLIPARPNCR